MKRPESGFDFEAHERMLAARYEQLARYEAFDKLVDMALDGVISMADAKTAWQSEVLEYDPELPAEVLVDPQEQHDDGA